MLVHEILITISISKIPLTPCWIHNLVISRAKKGARYFEGVRREVEIW